MVLAFAAVLVMTVPLWLAARLVFRRQATLEARTTRRVAWLVLSALAAAPLLVMGLGLAYPLGLVGDTDAGVLTVAALAARGGALYPAGADQATALLYGPLTFWPYAWALRAGAGLLGPKLVAALTALCAVTIVVRHLVQAIGDPRTRSMLLLGLGLVFLPQATLFVATKGDALALLACSLPLLARRPQDHGWLLGAAAALAGAAKAPAAIALLPLLALAPAGGRTRQLGSALFALAAITAVVLLALGDQVGPYLALLRSAAHHGLAGSLAAVNLLSLAPIAALLVAVRERRTLEGVDAALLIAGAALLLVSAKVGAGAQHLVVLLPACAGVLAARVRGGAAVPHLLEIDAGAALAAAAILSLAGLLDAGAFAHRARAAAQLAGTLPAALPAHVALAPSHDGLGRVESLLQPALVLAGAEAPVSVSALSDHALVDGAIAAPLRARLLDCGTTWLVAGDVDAPLGARSIYFDAANPRERGEDPSAGSLFDPELRTAFARRFAPAEAVGPFTAWRCRAAG